MNTLVCSANSFTVYCMLLFSIFLMNQKSHTFTENRLLRIRIKRITYLCILLRRGKQIRCWPTRLNTFYGRFECNGGSATLPISASGSSRQSSDNHVITVLEDEVRRALKSVNARKAAGPDGITGRVLRSCADQLAGLFTSIFNESLATSVIPTSFKNLSSSLCLRTINPLA